MSRVGALVGGASALAGTLACAQPWALDSGLSVRAEASDNATLGSGASPAGTNLTLGATTSLARQIDRSDARWDIAMTLRAADPGTGQGIQGRSTLSQSYALPKGRLAGSLSFGRDGEFGDPGSATDAALGRVRRDSWAVNGSWLHQLDERLGARAQATQSRVRFAGARLAADFDDRSLIGSLTYRVSEVTTTGLEWIRSDYRLTSGRGGSTSDTLRLTAEVSLHERAGISAAIGRYVATQSQVATGLVCPVPVSLCAVGAVAPVPVDVAIDRRSSGTSYSLSTRLALGEASDLSLSGSRQLAASGLGVQQSDELRSAWRQALSPTSQFTAGLAASRSQPPGATSGQVLQLLTADATWSTSLAPLWSLAVGGSHRRFSDARTGTESRATAISISLQYQAPRMFVSVP